MAKRNSPGTAKAKKAARKRPTAPTRAAKARLRESIPADDVQLIKALLEEMTRIAAQISSIEAKLNTVSGTTNEILDAVETLAVSSD